MPAFTAWPASPATLAQPPALKLTFCANRDSEITLWLVDRERRACSTGEQEASFMTTARCPSTIPAVLLVVVAQKAARIDVL